jgi:hypothetical protein
VPRTQIGEPKSLTAIFQLVESNNYLPVSEKRALFDALLVVLLDPVRTDGQSPSSEIGNCKAAAAATAAVAILVRRRAHARVARLPGSCDRDQLELDHLASRRAV